MFSKLIKILFNYLVEPIKGFLTKRDVLKAVF